MKLFEKLSLLCLLNQLINLNNHLYKLMQEKSYFLFDCLFYIQSADIYGMSVGVSIMTK